MIPLKVCALFWSRYFLWKCNLKGYYIPSKQHFKLKQNIQICNLDIWNARFISWKVTLTWNNCDTHEQNVLQIRNCLYACTGIIAFERWKFFDNTQWVSVIRLTLYYIIRSILSNESTLFKTCNASNPKLILVFNWKKASLLLKHLVEKTIQ